MIMYVIKRILKNKMKKKKVSVVDMISTDTKEMSLCYEEIYINIIIKDI